MIMMSLILRLIMILMVSFDNDDYNENANNNRDDEIHANRSEYVKIYDY